MKDNAVRLVEVLRTHGLTIGSCESVTGGLFGATLTDVDGSSAVYKGGIIAYSNDIKERLLNIPAETLEEEGAVSSTTAQLMAIHGLEILDVDICVSFTGNAGPTACDSKAEVGVCYLGIAFNGQIWSIPLRLTEQGLKREELKEVLVDSIINAVLSILAK